MKPSFKVIYHNCNSIVTAGQYGLEVKNCIDSIFNRAEYKRYLDSPISLLFTIYINADDSLIKGAYSLSGKVSVSVDQSLNGDHDIYGLTTVIASIKVSENCPRVLIKISTINSENDNQEQSEKPTYTAVDPLWTLEDTILPDNVVKRITRAVSIIKYKDIILNEYAYNRLDRTMKSIICLYGPPGTGKTRAAEGIASVLGKKILKSSYAQIESKYVGDGAKNLRAIFRAATEQDAVLFLDEADSFLSKRIESTGSSSDKHYNRMSNELFQLLEEHDGCIVFATNLLTDLDNAFKSRIVDSICIPLPDEDGRRRILNQMVPQKIRDAVFESDEEKYKTWLQLTEGFSGRDIRKSLLLTYADAAVAQVNNPNSFKWTYDIFVVGFNDVKNSFSEGVEEIPLEAVQAFEDEQRFKQKQIEIAKHAILADDDVVDDREYTLLNNLSQSLINKSVDKDDVIPCMNLNEICSNISCENDKLVLFDVAIRVVAADGNYSEKEKTFVHKLADLLQIEQSRLPQYDFYAQALVDAANLWSKANG